MVGFDLRTPYSNGLSLSIELYQATSRNSGQISRPWKLFKKNVDRGCGGLNTEPAAPREGCLPLDHRSICVKLFSLNYLTEYNWLHIYHGQIRSCSDGRTYFLRRRPPFLRRFRSSVEGELLGEVASCRSRVAPPTIATQF